MAATNISQQQLSFTRFSIVCHDIIKLPLIDILDHFIKPTELSTEIHACRDLLRGNLNKRLNRHQKKKCRLTSSTNPNYSTFDISLLYKLVRNLCSELKPENNWGKYPKKDDKGVVDDIERVKELRNDIAHIKSAELPDGKFQRRWNNTKQIIQRLENYTRSLGCNPDYVKKFEDLGRKTFTFDEYITQNQRLEGSHYNLQYRFY